MSTLLRRIPALVGASALILGMAPAVAHAEDRYITLVGSLQDEFGCAADWDPGCGATTLEKTGPATYQGRFTLPEGDYEYKVAANGSWDENYGAGGALGGPNLPIAVAGPAELLFEYDDETHLIEVTPTNLKGDRVTKADRRLAGPSLREALTGERFYFVMTDRFANGDPSNDLGGLSGDRLETGFDPSDVGFFHGGDLQGIMDHLDYIEDLGTTAIWLTPSFKNKPVQGSGADASAGYHGYWVTDFTQIDPHLGTNAEMKALIDQAHGRGMKVFFDIITNHTADVITYEEGQFTYISKETEPYRDAEGNVFDDAEVANSPDFPELNEDSFPYTPVFPRPEAASEKTPAWLNDVTNYHNRGDSTFSGESSTYGDFIGLDDLFTENPRVEQGMEEIYKAWADLGIDGFRIDTVKHVNLEFWQKFSPGLLEHASSIGNDDFFMFAEVFDGNPEYLSTFTKAGKLQAALDFGFQGRAVAVANGGPTTGLADLFAADDHYTDADSNAYQLPTFLGNHDIGRIGSFAEGTTQREKLKRDKFAHSLMYTLRGQPVVYYGDEQGFTGDGGDKAARQDMFASQSDQYNSDIVLGGPEGSRDRYNPRAPMYRHIAKLAKLRSAHPALADGTQITRYASDKAGIFAVSRIDRDSNREYLVVANNSDEPAEASFTTSTKNGRFRPLLGEGTSWRADQQGGITVQVPPLSVHVLRATRVMTKPATPPDLAFVTPLDRGIVGGNAEIRAAVPQTTPVEVTYAYRPAGVSTWTPLGTDDNAPYRVFHDVSGIDRNMLVEYRAIAKDISGRMSARSVLATVGDPPPPPSGPGVGDVPQPDAVAVPGDLNNEMGCAGDWDPTCDEAQLALDSNDNIWKGTFTLPAGDYSYKAAINRAWDENYGEGGQVNGANIALTIPAGGDDVTFWYDHRTNYITSSLEHPLVVAVGDFQSEMGCDDDWDPTCMRSWLQDPARVGTYALATVQVPAGSYEYKVALDGAFDTSYGAGGGGDNIPFTVEADGSVTTFAWDSDTTVPSVDVQPPPAVPDLDTADAMWLGSRAIAYPVSRLPAGTDPTWLRYRLHWGDLGIEAMTLGGRSVLLTPDGVTSEGYLTLRLPSWVRRSSAMRPLVAVGVSTDADLLVDATGVAPS